MHSPPAFGLYGNRKSRAWQSSRSRAPRRQRRAGGSVAIFEPADIHLCVYPLYIYDTARFSLTLLTRVAPFEAPNAPLVYQFSNSRLTLWTLTCADADGSLLPTSKHHFIRFLYTQLCTSSTSLVVFAPFFLFSFPFLASLSGAFYHVK